ncbi:ribosome silencing factor [Corynebacterium caspium]|uniref:ribosome silencing factor n=1 Tax=Corynebacterium caspium TaxID=234828 RepID=UPI0003677377|nr:ribosome silencing factor [Corynebacterium caspium]
MTVSDNSRKMAAIAALAADEKKAENIAAIDVSDVMAIADAFLIASASSERQVKAIADEVEDELSKAGHEPRRKEGYRENRWVLLDYGGLIVHVQRTQERDYYGLDRLYRDCPLIEIEGIEPPERPGEWAAAEEAQVRAAASAEELPLATINPADLEEDDYDY